MEFPEDFDTTGLRLKLMGHAVTTELFSPITFITNLADIGNAMNVRKEQFLDAYITGLDAMRNKLADITGDEEYRNIPISVSFDGSIDQEVTYPEEEE